MNGTRVNRHPSNQFEGYESWTCQVSCVPHQRVRPLTSSHQVKTRDSRKVPHPIPRGKLGYEVAKKLAAFLKVNAAVLTALYKFDVMNAVPEEASKARQDGHHQRGGDDS